MVRNARHRPRRPSRPIPGLEGLEVRRLFSIGGFAVPTGAPAASVAGLSVPGGAARGVLGVVSAEPAAGRALSASPTALTVIFSEPLAPASISGADLALEQVAGDGTLTPLIIPMTETLGRSGTELIAALPAGALAAGHYRMILPGSSLLLGADGAAPAPGDQVLGDFTVAPPPAGPSLAGASDLGALGPAPVTALGTLDLRANPGGAALYRFSLPAGQVSELDAAVSGRAGGYPLGSVLTLFDATGHPLALDQSGPAGAPDGPALRVVLGPGTYYLGVSGLGNIPGSPGGYDPSAAVAGTIPQAEAGGPFRLRIGVAAAGGPTTLQSFTLAQADPANPTPTGLALQFSGPVFLPGAGARVGGGQGGLSVVDQSGRAWPLVDADAEQGGASLSLLFRDHLTAGHYTVLVPRSGGLTDATGSAPVAPGEPAGVLATFDVAAASPRAPGDFGVITPGDALNCVDGGVRLAPGASSTFRFVVESPQVYNLLDLYAGGTISIQLAGPSGTTVTLDPGPSGDRFTNPLDLQPGVYLLTLTATGPTAVLAGIAIQGAASQTPPDLILPNGVGQAPALDLKLNAPTTPPSPVSPPSAPIAGPVAPPVAGALALSGSVLPTPTPTPTAAGAGLLLTPGGQAVGLPAAGAGHVAEVGRGVGVGESPINPGAPDSVPYAGADLPAAPNPRNDGAIAALAVPGSTAPATSAADAGPASGISAEGSGWMDRLRQALAALMPARVPDAVALGSPGPGVGADGQEPAEAVEVEQAGMGPNLGIGLAAVVAAQVVRTIRRRRDRGRRLALATRPVPGRRR